MLVDIKTSLSEGAGGPSESMDAFLKKYHMLISKTAVDESFLRTQCETRLEIQRQADSQWDRLRDDILTKGHLNLGNTTIVTGMPQNPVAPALLDAQQAAGNPGS